jgi:hypothetical protein
MSYESIFTYIADEYFNGISKFWTDFFLSYHLLLFLFFISFSFLHYLPYDCTRNIRPVMFLTKYMYSSNMSRHFLAGQIKVEHSTYIQNVGLKPIVQRVISDRNFLRKRCILVTAKTVLLHCSCSTMCVTLENNIKTIQTTQKPDYSFWTLVRDELK